MLKPTKVNLIQLMTSQAKLGVSYIQFYSSTFTLLHFNQKSDGRHVGFSTLPCRMYDTLVCFEASETWRRLGDT